MHAGLSLRKLQHIQTEDDVERIVKVKRTKINIEGPSGPKVLANFASNALAQ
jgi:hypothetical protein